MIGQTLAHYHVLEKLGEGGMGVVYKAKDTRLDRFVALKMLPAEKLADAERKARFVQEAKSASALNHPNIITIYDIGENFIAMEFVAGKTLGELIGRKGMKLGETLKYGAQIAGALAAAHGAGLIHRDLKPGNVMVTEAGLVKVLDFGLAKLTETATDELAETRTQRPATEEGTILGTAAYMSPEQAEGRKLDARSDIFSLGSVLYEMATGRRAFQGDSKMSTLSAVLREEPGPLPDEVPRELARIITRCLRKDPERRFQHVDDVKIALQELKEESDSGKLAPERAAQAARPRQAYLAAVVALAVTVAALAGWLWYSRARPPATQALLETVPLTTYPGSETSPSFSPDGSQVAFSWCRGADCHVYVKQIGIEEPYQLTNTSELDYFPAWSPDGAYIAFVRRLTKSYRLQCIVIPQRGGPERILWEFAETSFSQGSTLAALSWCPDSKSVVAPSPRGAKALGLDLISMAGGERRKLTDPGEARAIDAFPSVSPDSQWLAFTRQTGVDQGVLHLLRLSADCAPRGAPVKVEVGGQAAFSTGWTPDSHELLYSSGANVRLNLFRVSPGPPWVPAPVPVAGFSSLPFAVSRQGRLAFVRWSRRIQLWRIAAGQPSGTWSAPELFSSSVQGEMEPQYSPDGGRIAFGSMRSGQLQIWVAERNGANPVQLTFLGSGGANRPRWSPDGRWIVFYATVAGNRDIYVAAAGGGTPRRLTDHPGIDTNPEWSCDGKYIEFQSDRDPSLFRWRVPAGGGEAEKRTSDWAADSPDCQAVFYRDGGGRNLWRKPMDGGDAVMVAESIHPQGGWAIFPDGIYYIGQPEEGGPSPLLYRDFATGRTRRLASIPHPYWGLTVSPDRKSIVCVNQEPENDLMLVENFR